ncbi:hypothetical protein CEXT_766781 [Caerostris extrusa]|uniref:Uncharacterized protein n=1 Tax=Caerostris extrusa TaxID=172846 RepID=A0AAV4WFH5_CAEEX|nr:hypothetical protein CEXT_766781 [Caerostris extrusa]
MTGESVKPRLPGDVVKNGAPFLCFRTLLCRTVTPGLYGIVLDFEKFYSQKTLFDLERMYSKGIMLTYSIPLFKDYVLTIDQFV